MLMANEMTNKAHEALEANGAEISLYEKEFLVLVELPEGTEEADADEFTLPDGSKIGFHQEGDYFEGTCTICLK